MSTLEVNTITPQSGTTLTLGGSGQTVAIGSGATAGFGKIAQIVQTTKTNSFTTTSTSWVDITGFSCSITPSSTSSKVLVNVTCGPIANSGSWGNFINLLRGSTVLISNTDGGGADSRDAWNGSGGATDTDASRIMLAPSIVYLDSPSSTSALTYKCQFQNGGGSTTSYFNRWGVNNDHAGVSTITLMEVLA